MEKFTNEQMGQIEDNSFNPDQGFILANAEDITDFFGNNTNWYELLQKGGSTYGRISLNSTEEFDVDLIKSDDPEEQDLAPLDPGRINDVRAQSIAKFFEEWQPAKAALLEYLSH